jgi:hypothetical protein
VSFISALKAIEQDVVGVARISEPIAQMALSAVRPTSMLGIILGSIVSIEQLILSGTGEQKKTTVTQIVNTVLPGLDQVKLGAAIDSTVTALNSISSVTK